MLPGCHTKAAVLSWAPPVCPVSCGYSLTPSNVCDLPCRTLFCLFLALCGSCVLYKYANHLPSCAFQSCAGVSRVIGKFFFFFQEQGWVSAKWYTLRCNCYIVTRVTYTISSRCCQMICRVAFTVYTLTSRVQGYTLPPDCLLHILTWLLGYIRSFSLRSSVLPESSLLELWCRTPCLYVLTLAPLGAWSWRCLFKPSWVMHLGLALSGCLSHTGPSLQRESPMHMTYLLWTCPLSQTLC